VLETAARVATKTGEVQRLWMIRDVPPYYLGIKTYEANHYSEEYNMFYE
jgi:hypothetical protein